MDERRKEERKNLMAYTPVYDLYTGTMFGHLGDLSFFGLMVIGDKPAKEGLEITLAIELPELPAIMAKRITLPARVVWVKPDISPEFFNIGFQFKEVTPEQKTVIAAIIENYEFRREMPNYPGTKYSSE
jgi:Tfp pilus assembly protein PilZ